ncbi:hypothetical protein [Tolumonas lignilytica]|jgi:hypothetical protein|uniref:hypothetical protein n=1 Tax=Tolumonas lignilytica TaxID=1283284 RepID=UPI001268516A|nr:hypothetical protein [Tolumonas lignilytica]
MKRLFQSATQGGTYANASNHIPMSRHYCYVFRQPASRLFPACAVPSAFDYSYNDMTVVTHVIKMTFVVG